MRNMSVSMVIQYLDLIRSCLISHIFIVISRSHETKMSFFTGDMRIIIRHALWDSGRIKYGSILKWFSTLFNT